MNRSLSFFNTYDRNKAPDSVVINKDFRIKTVSNVTLQYRYIYISKNGFVYNKKMIGTPKLSKYN